MYSSYDKFARQFSDAQGETGDAVHRVQLDPHIYAAVGNPKNKIIYDIGCGNGYMSRYFARRGAKVFASDISRELIQIAKNKSKGLDITYNLYDATSFELYKSGSFDAIVMNMVIHYVKNIDKLCKGISNILKPRGIFVFSTNHFLRPVFPFSEWTVGKLDGEEKLFIKVTGYLKKEERSLLSWWDQKTKIPLYNHPLNELLNTMAKYNLYSYHVSEPESEGVAKNRPKHLQKSSHIPTYIIIAAKKF